MPDTLAPLPTTPAGPVLDLARFPLALPPSLLLPLPFLRFCAAPPAGAPSLPRPASPRLKLPSSSAARAYAGATATVHFRARLADGGALLHDTYADGAPLTLRLGVEPSEAVAGWELALPAMRVGEVARLRCAHEVVREDIVEARRLMTLSKSSIYDAADGDADGAKNKVDPVSVVYQIIREHARANRLPAVNVSEILPKVLSRGRTKEDLERCMGEYEELDVWQVNADRTIIRFVT